MRREYFSIDLKERSLETRLYPYAMLKADIELCGVKSPMDLDLLDGFNNKIFKSMEDADAWRNKYLEAKEYLLKNAKSQRGLKKMLCKQRYIILAYLKEKNFTLRSYKKNIQKGELFQLYDQTIFLTVKLKKITEQADGMFCYDYELP